MVAYVKHALARPNARVGPEADVMHMLDGRRIADAVDLPRLLLDNDGQQLDLVLPSRGLCVLNNLPAATRSQGHGTAAQQPNLRPPAEARGKPAVLLLLHRGRKGVCRTLTSTDSTHSGLCVTYTP